MVTTKIGIYAEWWPVTLTDCGINGQRFRVVATLALSSGYGGVQFACFEGIDAGFSGSQA